MHQRKQLIDLIRTNTIKYPHLKSQLLEILDLYDMEVEDGGSPDNEYNLAVNNIEEIISEQEN